MPRIKIPGSHLIEKAQHRGEFYRPPKIESMPSPEKLKWENQEAAMTPEMNAMETSLAEMAASNAAGATAALPLATITAENYKKVEDILAEDLGELYFRLPPLKQREFKIKGEETTRAILRIIAQPKIKIKKIISLIKRWLAMLPGMNRFFLEQMAKIKADKIIALLGRDRDRK